MKNVFSANEPQPEVDPAFAQQARQQAGGPPLAPATETAVPLVPCNPTHSTILAVLAPPDFENLATRSAPGHAASSDF